jgi:anti-sigma factor RsiW
MNCPQIRKLLHACHDGELDAANTLQIDEHLSACPACSEALRQLTALGQALSREELRHPTPEALRQAVRSAIAQEAFSPEPRKKVIAPRWQSAGLAIAAAVALAATIFAFRSGPAHDQERLIGEITSSHVRSLMASHLMDVPSTDQHTVKPWFDGKLDFAPPVRDFRESGFPLLGGRLDVVDSHPAAALVYGREKHLLNLFVWPATAPASSLHVSQRNGYNLVQWSDGKMNFCAVSDLNETELRFFAGLWSGG